MSEPTRDTTSLRERWDREAASWVRWARSHEADHGFWRLNMPRLLALLPAAGELTVDVGCGEGRFARELIARGHRVVGVEGSEALAEAARSARPAFEVHVADAAAMPLPDGCADLVVASLSLMNMDDMPAVVREVARVVRPGGRFCFSILHPLNSWGDAGTASYFEPARYAEEIRSGDAALTLHETHRPLSDYAAALAHAGFLVERICEPRPDGAHVAAHPDASRWRDRPAFLHVRAVLGAAQA